MGARKNGQATLWKKQFSELLQRINGWLSDIDTSDERWSVYTTSKWRSLWFRASSTPQAQRKPGPHQLKVTLCTGWYCEGVIYFELLQTNISISADIYCPYLDRTANAPIQKYPSRGPAWLLLDNTDTNHGAAKYSLHIKWEVLLLHNSSDLAPTEYPLFSHIQMPCKGRRLMMNTT